MATLTLTLGWRLIACVLFLTTQSSGSAHAQYTERYIPWSWQVEPDYNYTTSGSENFCPSVTSILGTFGIINILVSLFGLLFGNRKVIKFLTCGFFDGEDDKPTWFYMFIFPLAINLGPNALIAYLYKTTPGFGDTFSIGDLTLFYTTRPRLSWLVLVVFMSIDADRKNNDSYTRSAKASVAAEFCLQLISSYYTGRTVHFAAANGYYSHPGSAPADARTMYAGALLSLVSLFFTLCSLVYILYAEPGVGTTFFAAILISCTSWLGSWIFWGGFVRLSGNSYGLLLTILFPHTEHYRYCPPQLLPSGVIWTAFSVLGKLA